MGADRSSGVVDHCGRVFEGHGDGVHDGLYVIDGSIIPRSLGCNPLLTITALAERAMLHLGLDRGLDMSDEQSWNGPAISVMTPGAVVKLARV